MLTDHGAAFLGAALDELLARRPAELIPYIGFGAEAEGIEMNANGIGLHRRPVVWSASAAGERFGATWTTTKRDWLPCTVGRIGVALEPGGPARYVLEVGPVTFQQAGDVLNASFVHPVVATT